MKYINRAFNSDYGGFAGSSSGGGGGGGQGVPITNAANIVLLTNNANWNSANTYTGAALTGQSEGDYYDSGTIRYYVTATAAMRIPYANL